MNETANETLEPRIWVIRPGRNSSLQERSANERIFAEKGIAGLCDDYCVGNLRRGNRTRSDLRALVASNNPEMHPSAVANVVSNLARLADDVQIGDWVVCPSRITNVYRVGIVSSEYRFVTKAAFQHARDVKWAGEISRAALSKKAQRELAAARLFFECKRNADEVISHLSSVIKEAKGV